MKTSVTADVLRERVERFVGAYAARTGERAIWRPPLLATAEADGRFAALPRMAAPDHLLPAELLAGARSVVVFFVPFKATLAAENHAGKLPCRQWGLAYESTNRLINALSAELKTLLQARGHGCALTPATHNFDPQRLVARWSHKHLGYLAGLGRFGVNAQFITPSGCAGRLGSLVTTAVLGDSPLVAAKELCLYKTGHTCLKCVARCPVQAVGIEGIDRRRCWQRLNFNLDRGGTLTGLEKTTHVCGKCQVNLPCSLGVPLPV